MKKVLAICMIISLLINLMSCYSYRQLTSMPENKKFSGNRAVKVVYAETKEGKKYDFDLKSPAKFTDQGIAGYPLIRFRYGTGDSVHFKRGTNVSSIWKDGIKYEILGQDTSGMLCRDTTYLTIAFSDIANLKLRKPDAVKTLGLLVGTLGVLAGIIAIVVANMTFDIQLGV